MCPFTDIKNIRITRLFVCARLIDQFTKIYDPPFGPIYRESWWPICHNLQGFFNLLVVLQIEDLRPACTNTLSWFCLSLKVVCLCFLYCCSGRSRGGARGGPPPFIFRPNWGKLRKQFFGGRPPPPTLSQDLNDRAPLLSEGLDTPLCCQNSNFFWPKE